MLRSRHNYKSNSNDAELHSKSQDVPHLKETYSKEQIHVLSVHKENWNYNTSVKHPFRGLINMPTVLKKDLNNSVINQSEMSKRTDSNQLKKMIPKEEALKSTNFKRKNKCQKNTSSPMINRRRSNRKSNSKYRTKTPDRVEADEPNDMSRVNNDSHKHHSPADRMLQKESGDFQTKIEEKPPEIEKIGDPLGYIPKIDEKSIGVKRKRGRPRKIKLNCEMPVTSSNKSQVDNDVPVNVTNTSVKTGEPIPTELMKTNCKRSKELEMVPVPVKRKKDELSHRVHSYKQYIKETEKENASYITKTFSRITIAKSSETGISVNQSIVPYKNCIDIHRVSVIPLVRVEDMPLAQLSKLLRSPSCTQSTNTREINKAYYEKKKQHSAYVTETTTVEQSEEINVLYHKPLCEKQHINMIKEVNANKNHVEQGMSSVNVPMQTKLIDNIRILRTSKNISPFTVEDALQFFLKFRDLTYRTIKRESEHTMEHVHTCAAMCSNCKQAFDLLQHFSGKVNLKDEKISVECIPCKLRINRLSHLQEHVMNVHLKCEGNGKKGNKYPAHIINFNKKFDNKKVKTICACCCCPKIFQTIRWFENHINKFHEFNISTSDNNCQDKQTGKDAQLHKLCKNLNTSDEDYMLNRNPIFNLANNVNDSCSERRDINHGNHNSIHGCINTRELNITNSLYCNNSNNQSTLLKWSMKVEEKNIILQKNKDFNLSRDKINEIIGATPVITRKARKTRQNCRRYIKRIDSDDIHKNDIHRTKRECKKDDLLLCSTCYKPYKTKKWLAYHISSCCNTHRIGKKQGTKNTNDNSTSKLQEDSITSTTGIINSINLEEANQPEAPKNRITDKIVNDAGNENGQYAGNEENASIENMHINLMENPEEIATKLQQSFEFNITNIETCEEDTKEQEEVKDKNENESLVSLNLNEENIDTTEEDINAPKKWRCNTCNKQFNSRTVLGDHMFFFHDEKLDDAKSSSELSELCLNSEQNEIPQDNRIFEETNNATSELQTCNGTFKRVLCNRQIFKKSKTWRCGDCDENFAFLRNYLRHKYDCHGDESVVHICDNCNRILTSVKMVNTHVCMKVTTWTCKRCNLYFPNGIFLMRHNEKLHFETVGPHACEICGSTFLTNHMLNLHRDKHIKDDPNSLYQILTWTEENNLPSTSNIEIQATNDSVVLSDKNQLPSEMLEELNKVFSKMYITCNSETGQEVIFKCNNCNALYAMESEMREHLMECCRLDKCQICNIVNPTYKLREHLIHEHLVVDSSHFQENNIERIFYREGSINDITSILGLRRLLCLYEYQKFDGNLDHIQCDLCPEQISNSQLYRVHYLQYHDTVCLLCNIEFHHSIQALEHKIKIHKSIDSYLWIVQMLISAASYLGDYKNTIEHMVLQIVR